VQWPGAGCVRRRLLSVQRGPERRPRLACEEQRQQGDERGEDLTACAGSALRVWRPVRLLCHNSVGVHSGGSDLQLGKET